MPSSRAGASVLLALALAVGCSSPAAAEGNDRGQALARAKALLRQVNAEKQALASQLAQARADMDEQAAKLKGAEDALRTSNAALAAAEKALAESRSSGETGARELQRTRERLEESRSKLAEATEGRRDARAALARSKSDNEALTAQLETAHAELSDAEQKNESLFKLHAELLDRYSREGLLTRLLRREPVTGLAAVKAETFVQEHDTRAHDARRRVEP